MIRLFYIGIIFMLLPSGIHAQFTAVTSPTDEIIYDVTFTSENEGWAVGLGGIILHFNGTEWEVYDVLTGNSFNRVAFTTENDGWAITGNGKIFHYDGNAWSLNFTATGNKGLYSLYFLDTGEGYATGADGYLAYYDGTQWIEGNIGFDALTLTSYFQDNKNGWLSGGAAELYQFKDSVWSKVAVPGAGAFFEMKFISPDNGYAVGFDDAIWHYDGNSWGMDYESTNSQAMLDIHFFDENHGWASGQGSLFTYQYGVWKEENIDPNWEIWDFHFTDQNHGWAVGSDGLLLRYAPEPLEWQTINEISLTFYINEISRNPEGDLYAIGYKEGVLNTEKESALYKSSDGLMWERISSELDQLSITNTILALEDVLLVSGIDKDFNFLVYKSVDDGLTWTVSTTGFSSQTLVEDMTVDENGVVYAIANHFEPELYRSEDLGDTWTLINTNGFPIPTDPSEADFVSIAAIGTQLFVFHQETENNISGIYTSTNGVDWAPLANTLNESFVFDLHASESGLLYASGAALEGNEIQGVIYVSGDLGASWQLIDTKDLNQYNAVFVTVASLGEELFLSAVYGTSGLNFQVITTLKPQTQSISFGVLPPKTYGDQDFELTASASSGLPVAFHSLNPEVARVTGNSVRIEGAGMATIVASQAGNAVFQAANNIEQPIIIEKATLEVTVASVSRDEGEPNPLFELNYDGWVNGDNIDDLNVVPTASTIADLSSPEGTYPITISGGMDNNYEFEYVQGVLTINKMAAIITGPDNPSPLVSKLFPNPVRDKLKLMPGAAAVSGQVLVYNATGSVIHQQKFSDQILEIDFGAYSEGIYLIKIISSERSVIHQVIKK